MTYKIIAGLTILINQSVYSLLYFCFECIWLRLFQKRVRSGTLNWATFLFELRVVKYKIDMLYVFWELAYCWMCTYQF